MQLDPHPASSTSAVRDDPPVPAAARARPPPLALNGAEARPAPPLLGAAVPPARKGPPRLTLGVASTISAPLDRPSPTGGPAVTVQPASPAMSTSSTPSTSPFPPPVPSTSSLDTAQQAARAPSFQPPPSSVANGGGLAARRAAKLGKKRLSLVVPANPHSSLPSAGPDGPSATTLLSPVTPSFLRPSTSSMDAETRSLPPSPLLLTTFIGAEGTEAPDRTIGRLMLKQQADEMREQMRGGRGMKRRTSIPRLNLVRGGASAHPASLDPTAPPVERVATPAAGGGGGAPSAVQLIRGDAVERGLAADGDVAVEEFPYANGPREIIPGVFLGSEQNAKDAQVLRDWRIGFVLNVAKEVECPWSADDEDGEAALVVPQVATPGRDGARSSEPARGAPSGQPRSAKAQPSPASTFASSASPYGAAAASQPPVRPPFVRPTASTPNLHAVFHPPSPPPPAVPAIPASFLPSPPDSDPMLRSLSTSPPQQSRRLSRQSLRRSGGSTTSATTATATTTTATTSSCPGSVRYTAQARTGRPSLEYLWLKWGHDEADLVEAHKFQAAFAFLDSAREQGERVLVHCQCGVSRSATVVIAYCMREAARALAEGRDSDELAGCTGMHDTYSFVKEKSEWVGPNLSLVFQLVAYERTLRGDSASGEEGDEPPYPHYPPEPTSARPADDDDDLPPPTPAVGFSPFAFPPPPPSASYGTSVVNGHANTALPSPRTPSSIHPISQLSTPDLAHHDPLVSPSLSTATKASSVTSTPGSAVGHRGLSPQAVRIVRAADDGEHELAASAARASHSSSETLGAPESGKAVPFGAFTMPPPSPSHYMANLEDAASPTTALYPPGVPRHEAHGLPAQVNGRSHFAPPLRTSSLRAALPPLQVHLPSPPSSAPRHSSPITMVVNSPSSPAPPRQLPPLQLSRPRPTVATVTSPLSPGSNASVTSPTAILSALSLSSSSGSSASLAAPLSALSRTNSTSSQTSRRFGVSQTALERRASHRRVCSDTIRVPVAGLTAAGASPGGSRPASPAQVGGSTRSVRAEEQQG